MWVVPDMHQNEYLMQELKKLNGEPNVILLGDYVDAFEPDYAAPVYLNMVFDLLDKNPTWVALLGNHDTHYIWPKLGLCSGFQREYAPALHVLFKSRLDRFKMCHVDYENKIIYTHAGISKKWLDYVNAKYGFDSLEDIEYFLNTFPKEAFMVGPDNQGFDQCCGPLWLRPKSYESVFEDYTQIVGHTRSNKISKYNNLHIYDVGCINSI